MKITIEIETDNAAFGPDEADRDDEIERILREWLRRGVSDRRLMDSNGNTVGSVTVRGK